MEREPVWYGDLDLAPPTPEQYHENLLRQIDRETIDPDTPTWDLERMIDTQNFIPIVNDEYKLVFCQVTRSLPELCQTHIWSALMQEDESLPPSAPKKKKHEPSDRMISHMARWAVRKQLTF